MTEPRFGQVITAMVTPFTESLEVDFDKAAILADYLVTHGSDGIVVAGTTGESPTLTREEEYFLFKVVKDAVAGRGSVIAGTGSNNTAEAIEATRKAAEIGVDATLQVVPYYNKPSQEGMFQHFKAIAEAVPKLPVILYNIPGRTGVSILPETVSRLSKIRNIVGIKESTGSMDQVTAIRQSTPAEFMIYSGDDSLTLPIMAMGGCGIISVVSHLAGPELKEMCVSMAKGDLSRARSIHIALFDLIRVMFMTTNPVPLKTALEMVGFPVGGTRSPLVAMSEKEREQLKEVLKRYSLIK